MVPIRRERDVEHGGYCNREQNLFFGVFCEIVVCYNHIVWNASHPFTIVLGLKHNHPIDLHCFMSFHLVTLLIWIFSG